MGPAKQQSTPVSRGMNARASSNLEQSSHRINSWSRRSGKGREWQPFRWPPHKDAMVLLFSLRRFQSSALPPRLLLPLSLQPSVIPLLPLSLLQMFQAVASRLIRQFKFSLHQQLQFH